MKPFRYGQIWLVNFDPSFGHEYQKVRPAIIVQGNNFIEQNNLLTVIPISSQLSKLTILDVLIEKDDFNRLAKDSLAKTKQISSFDKRRFFKYIGELQKHSLEKIAKNVCTYLNLEGQTRKP